MGNIWKCLVCHLSNRHGNWVVAGRSLEACKTGSSVGAWWVNVFRGVNTGLSMHLEFLFSWSFSYNRSFQARGVLTWVSWATGLPLLPNQFSLPFHLGTETTICCKFFSHHVLVMVEVWYLTVLRCPVPLRHKTFFTFLLPSSVGTSSIGTPSSLGIMVFAFPCKLSRPWTNSVRELLVVCQVGCTCKFFLLSFYSESATFWSSTVFWVGEVNFVSARYLHHHLLEYLPLACLPCHRIRLPSYLSSRWCNQGLGADLHDKVNLVYPSSIQVNRKKMRRKCLHGRRQCLHSEQSLWESLVIPKMDSDFSVYHEFSFAYLLHSLGWSRIWFS